MKIKTLTVLAMLLLYPFALAEDINVSSKKQIPPFDINFFKFPDDLKDEITGYRKQWNRLTGFEFSGLHWNQFVMIFTNKGINTYRNNYREHLRILDEDLDYEEDETFYKPYPVGTVILKEGFNLEDGKPGKPLHMSGMKKHKKGYDPDNGDWEYFQFDTQGNYLIRGNGQDLATAKLCQKCHDNVSHRDYVFSTTLSNKRNAN